MSRFEWEDEAGRKSTVIFDISDIREEALRRLAHRLFEVERALDMERGRAAKICEEMAEAYSGGENWEERAWEALCKAARRIRKG